MSLEMVIDGDAAFRFIASLAYEDVLVDCESFKNEYMCRI